MFGVGDFWLIFMGIKQKKIFQNGRLKKLSFSKPPILNIFSQKFQGLVLGYKESIDAKGIAWLNLCGCQAVQGEFTAM